MAVRRKVKRFQEVRDLSGLSTAKQGSVEEATGARERMLEKAAISSCRLSSASVGLAEPLTSRLFQPAIHTSFLNPNKRFGKK
jgi:hypothetical protein